MKHHTRGFKIKYENTVKFCQNIFKHWKLAQHITLYNEKFPNIKISKIANLFG